MLTYHFCPLSNPVKPVTGVIQISLYRCKGKNLFDIPNYFSDFLFKRHGLSSVR